MGIKNSFISYRLSSTGLSQIFDDKFRVEARGVVFILVSSSSSVMSGKNIVCFSSGTLQYEKKIKPQMKREE